MLHRTILASLIVFTSCYCACSSDTSSNETDASVESTDSSLETDTGNNNGTESSDTGDDTSHETDTQTSGETDSGDDTDTGDTDSETDDDTGSSDTDSETGTGTDTGSESDTSSDTDTIDTSSNSDTGSDTSSDTDTGFVTDCSLLEDFDICGEGEICFEGSCISISEVVVDTHTVGFSGIGQLNSTGGSIWAIHSYGLGGFFSTSSSSIYELENGDVKGTPHAEIEGRYYSMAGPIVVGSDKTVLQYQSDSWELAGTFADALEASETNEANTFTNLNDVTYTHSCDNLGCMEYTNYYEVLGANDADEQLVRRCTYSAELMNKTWSCGADISIPLTYRIIDLLAFTASNPIGGSNQYSIYASGTKPAGYQSGTNILLKAEFNDTWEFVEQGAVEYHSELGFPSHIAGTSTNNIWMVGSKGFVAHWNGSELTEHSNLFPYDATDNRYNFSKIHLTKDRVYMVGSRRDKKCDGSICDARLGAIIVAHNLKDDHADPSTYRIHPLSELRCQTDQGKDDPDYKACVAVSMVDSASDIMIQNDEVYIVGGRWFDVEDQTVSRATIWYAKF